MHWLGPALVFYVSVASLVVAGRRLASLERLRLADAQAMIRTIQFGSREDLERALSRSAADSYEESVLAAVLSNETQAIRVATVNEHFGDIEHELESRRDVASSVGKAALVSGTLASVVELAMTVPTAAGPGWGPAAVSFFLGLGAWLGVGEIDRRCRAMSALVRSEWDGVGVALGDWLHREAGQPGATSGR